MTIITRIALPTAQENMDHDAATAGQASPPTIRIYTWPAAGITYPERRPGPALTWNIDTGHRPTGGGILFHSPGSIVFSIVAPMDDVALPRPLKSKLATVGQWIREGLNSAGYPTSPDTECPQYLQNRLFCTSYHNPYELRFNGEKVAAMALRKSRSSILIQGIIHVVSNHPYFEHLGTEVRPYLSSGLGGTIDDTSRITDHLISKIPETLGFTLIL